MNALRVAYALVAGLLLGLLLSLGRTTLVLRERGINEFTESIDSVEHPRPEQLSISTRLEEILATFEEASIGRSAIVQSGARALNLAQFCREAHAADLPNLFEAVANLDVKMLDQTLALKVIGARWAESDPQAASEAAARLDGKTRAAVEHSIWPVWALRNLSEFRTHIELLREELGKNGTKAKVPFRDPVPWVKMDPVPALEALLESDWRFFESVSIANFKGAPPLTATPLPFPSKSSSGWFGENEGVPPMLELWLGRDKSAAMDWVRDVIARDEVQPRYRFLLLDRLSQKGYDAAAADLALHHLTEDLQVIALERILNRWILADPEAANSWQHAEGLLQGAQK